MKRKFCQVGQHEVDKLFHREIPGERQSCCSIHKPKIPIKVKVGDLVKPKGRGNYKSIGRIVSVVPSGSNHKIKVKKPKKESISALIAKAQEVFNRWIRKRDSHYDQTFMCISCNKWHSVKMMDAGHFWPVTYSFLRFNEDNTNSECKFCNRDNPNHLKGYEVNLKAKIGLERFNSLKELRHQKVKWDRASLLEIIEKYS